MKNPFAAAAAFAERLSDPNAASARPARPAENKRAKSSTARPSFRMPSFRPAAAPKTEPTPPEVESAPTAEAPYYEAAEAVPSAGPAYGSAPVTPRVTEERWGSMRVQTIELPASAFIRRKEELRTKAAQENVSRHDAGKESSDGYDFSYYDAPAVYSPAETDGIIPDSESDDLTPAFLSAMTEEEPAESAAPEVHTFSPEEDASASEGAFPDGEEEFAEAEAARPAKKKKNRVDIDVEETGSVLWAGAILIGLVGTAVAFLAACFS